jgi:hypothetical protein
MLAVLISRRRRRWFYGMQYCKDFDILKEKKKYSFDAICAPKAAVVAVVNLF